MDNAQASVIREISLKIYFDRTGGKIFYNGLYSIELFVFDFAL